jgi:S1-C subfamily serine protease
MEPRVENGELVVRYLSYPRVVSVDPSSPAQIAGIVSNDTLLAYDGRDVRENDINLNQLLRPAARVTVRLRRDGRTREVPVTIAEAPSRVAMRRTDEVRDGSATLVPMPDVSFPRVPQPTMVGSMARASARAGTVAPGAPQAPFVFNFTVNGVAGAQLATVSEGLGKRIGVSGGVLVTSAPPGSPASESGLEDGDVIVKVANQAVRTVLDVRRAVGAVNENGQRAVELELLRDGKTVRTTLRW